MRVYLDGSPFMLMMMIFRDSFLLHIKPRISIALWKRWIEQQQHTHTKKEKTSSNNNKSHIRSFLLKNWHLSSRRRGRRFCVCVLYFNECWAWSCQLKYPTTRVFFVHFNWIVLSSSLVCRDEIWACRELMIIVYS